MSNEERAAYMWQIHGLKAEILELEAERAALIFALRYIKGQAHIGHIHDTADAAIRGEEGK